jgi:hypothetical protein
MENGIMKYRMKWGGVCERQKMPNEYEKRRRKTTKDEVRRETSQWPQKVALMEGILVMEKQRQLWRVCDVKPGNRSL